MKIPTNLFKFSFIALGWIVFILLCYVAFKDEKGKCSDNNEGQPT